MTLPDHYKTSPCLYCQHWRCDKTCDEPCQSCRAIGHPVPDDDIMPMPKIPSVPRYLLGKRVSCEIWEQRVEEAMKILQEHPTWGCSRVATMLHCGQVPLRDRLVERGFVLNRAPKLSVQEIEARVQDAARIMVASGYTRKLSGLAHAVGLYSRMDLLRRRFLEMGIDV